MRPETSGPCTGLMSSARISFVLWRFCLSAFPMSPGLCAGPKSSVVRSGSGTPRTRSGSTLSLMVSLFRLRRRPSGRRPSRSLRGLHARLVRRTVR
nr:MAG TPA: hypothetical protein [Caudoviricetes sp.]